MSLAPDQVSVVLVTRGDVNMQPILETIPEACEVVVWDNSRRPYDAGVFGRYVAIAEATRPVIAFQDDDCLVDYYRLLSEYQYGTVVGFGWGEERMAKYHDTTLLGWGSIFDRELPFRAFSAFSLWADPRLLDGLGAEIVFPMLSTPRTVMLDEIRWLEDGGLVLERKNRMWKQPGFYERLDFWLGVAREVRDRLAA